MINFDYRTDLVTGIIAPFYHPETLNLFGGFFTQKTRFIVDPQVNNTIFMSSSEQVPIARISRFDIVIKGLEVVAYLDQKSSFYQSLRTALRTDPEKFCLGTTSMQQAISVDTSKKQILTYIVMSVYLTSVPAQPPSMSSFV